MNPIYWIQESPHKWPILAGISFLAGIFGADFMLALVWPHTVARVWLVGYLLLAVYFLARAFLEWKARLDEGLADGESAPSDKGSAVSDTPP
jgi:hypothetical protein